MVAPAFDNLSHVLLLASGRVDRDEASLERGIREIEREADKARRKKDGSKKRGPGRKH